MLCNSIWRIYKGNHKKKWRYDSWPRVQILDLLFLCTDMCRRRKFRFRRRSDTSEMAEHLIDLVSKPMCLIKLIDFSF